MKSIKKHHVTQTEYFTFSRENTTLGKFLISTLSLVMRLINRVLNRLFHFGIQTISQIKPERWSYSSDEIIIENQRELLVNVILEFLGDLRLNRTRADLREDVEKYDFIFRKNIISDLHGGMGYNNGLILFCFTKAINADLVIESGVWKGFTTMLLVAGTRDASEILCFDINLSKVEWKSSKAQYYEKDITDIHIDTKGKKCLALFDDHVSHYDRLIHCYDNSIDNIIFDDDVSVENVHSDGWPPIPSIDMVRRYNSIPHTFNWVSNGRVGRADISGLTCSRYSEEYVFATPPDIYDITGYRNTSTTTYARRKSAL